MRDYDVVVCGAGVGGLTAARAFARQGRRVLLVEKQPVPAPVHKGELLQPRSVQILDGLGALPRLAARGALRAPRLACRTADGVEVGALDYRLLPPPFDHCLVHYYADIKAAIGTEPGDGVEVRSGVLVERLRCDGAGRVVGVRLADGDARTDVDAHLVVGCDGNSSRIRTDAGIAVERTRYPHDLIGFDLTGVTGLGDDVVAHLTRDGLRLLFPMPGDRARLYVQLPGGEFRRIGRPGLPVWIGWLLRTVPALAPIADRLRDGVASAQALAAWRFNAPTWTRPGLALLGDAAHCVHPMAGQGMNAAIADAWTLSEQLAGADRLTAAVIDAALSRYDQVRRPRIDYVSRLSHNLATLFTDTGWRGQVLGRHVLQRNRRNRRLQFIITYNMSGLGVHRFTRVDRLVQLGLLPDPRAGTMPALPLQRRGEEDRHVPH